MASAEAQTANL